MIVSDYESFFNTKNISFENKNIFKGNSGEQKDWNFMLPISSLDETSPLPLLEETTPTLPLKN